MREAACSTKQLRTVSWHLWCVSACTVMVRVAVYCAREHGASLTPNNRATQWECKWSTDLSCALLTAMTFREVFLTSWLTQKLTSTFNPSIRCARAIVPSQSKSSSAEVKPVELKPSSSSTFLMGSSPSSFSLSESWTSQVKFTSEFQEICWWTIRTGYFWNDHFWEKFFFSLCHSQDLNHRSPVLCTGALSN